MKVYLYIIFVVCFSFSQVGFSQTHPALTLTQKGVKKIQSENASPLFTEALKESYHKVDDAIRVGIQVPIPKDMAGGYTHEVHKANYSLMQLAGNLYQISGDKKYADFVKDLLMEYAKIYKSLPTHPTKKSYATGKIFWQCLNDANWLVYTAQAYDCIYDYLSMEERKHLQDELFRPFADFISIENPQFFNRIHNHSTWGNAAVGMIGLAMRDEALIERSLYGIKDIEIDTTAKDNDGGYIYDQGKMTAGFLAQIDYAFSPDGYYNEGPYYQRYALLPFLVFAQALDNVRPELKIFEYRDSILIKSVKALLYQTNQSGEFFPINDAQKGMSVKAESMVTVLNIAYGIYPDPVFLQAAKLQGKVVPDQNGFDLAKQLAQKDEKPVLFTSTILRDGKDGDEGALMILRSKKSKDQTTLVFKCTSQGLGHGHYDKLSYSLYHKDHEILQDYGAARWVNIDQKAGGRYLPENESWAKQSIAHNTLVVDETSHFGGVYSTANLYHSEPLYHYTKHEECQVVSAEEKHAYPDVTLKRTLLMWENDFFTNPVIIDVISAKSATEHTYDLPFQFAGQVLKTNFAYQIERPLIALGKDQGYQHLYKEAAANLGGSNYSINWMKDGLFFTARAVADLDDEVIFARIGANDPNFNLRRDPLFIHRKKASKNTAFLSVIEQHGSYSPVTEVPVGPYSCITNLQYIFHDDRYSIFKIHAVDRSWLFYLSHNDGSQMSQHEVIVEGNLYKWAGPIKIEQF